MNCIICDSVMEQSGKCPACGFDQGQNYLLYPSLVSQVPAESLRELRRAWAKKNEGKLPCPKCGSFGFSVLIGEKTLSCNRCGFRFSRGGVARILGLAEDTAEQPESDSESGQEPDEIRWGIDTDSGELVISGRGRIQNFQTGKTPWYSYRWILRKVVIEEGVTEIGDFAFYGCSRLEELQLPTSLRRIGNSAFGYCPKLEKVQLPEKLSRIGENAFKFCSALREIKLPGGLSSLGESAFLSCVNVEKLIISSTRPQIGKNAFYLCDQLSRIDYVGTQEEWIALMRSRENDGLARTPVRCLADEQRR
ncbi:MAG: leucine-rich repeat domain-containing protein [Oscillospiraceae bacterium]|nr:leucine-rich repeat domain-containing protein [Oscillospiraceae bacterium]